jgi:predicted nuclease of predicted toxin-antitoxin system
MRFHLDENVDHAIARGLLRRSIDVTTSTDATLIGAADEEQLAFATREERVLVTHDRDHLRLHGLGIPHTGIAYCPSGSRSIGEMIRQLVLMHECLDDDAMRGQVEHL